ncbi:MAG: hypothetical protein Q9182_005356 [Xanthomendoza sp. 2 TL-2023]
MRIINVVVIASSLLRSTLAVPWVEPLPTPQGYLFHPGVSPRPTDAPGLNGIPKELVRRQQDVIYPPPPNWCGFITGDYNNPLTCKSPYTCVNSRSAVGCCPNTLPGCTNIYTDCRDFGDLCEASCEKDDKTLKCSESARPHCGTYQFSGGTRLYNCESTTGFRSSVEFLADYYITAVSKTLAPSTDPFSTRSSSASPYTSSYSSDDGGGLSAEAIRGIAIGVSVGVCVIFIALAMFIVRRRRARRVKKAAQPTLPPAYSPNVPMQQQAPGSNHAYQPVPQQDQNYSSAQPGYFPPGTVDKNNGTTVTSQPSTAASPPVQTPQQRHSTAPSSFLSPNASDHGRDSLYRPNGPVSPTITEVDGSGRPLPEADSIERPTSTHQGMVSPVQTGGHGGSPLPPYAPPLTQQSANQEQQQQRAQQSGIPQQQPGQGQMQTQSGYVAPRAGTYEVAPTQAYAGPYEMPDGRH